MTLAFCLMQIPMDSDIETWKKEAGMGNKYFVDGMCGMLEAAFVVQSEGKYHRDRFLMS